MQLLGGHQREALGQVETHLVAEHRAGTGAGAVVLVLAVRHHMAQEIQIGLHATGSRRRDSNSRNRPNAITGRLSSWPMVSQPQAMKPMSASGWRMNSTAKRKMP